MKTKAKKEIKKDTNYSFGVKSHEEYEQLAREDGERWERNKENEFLNSPTLRGY